jgi:alkylated DNA repair protein (DNA oxidative demethylase)
MFESIKMTTPPFSQSVLWLRADWREAMTSKEYTDRMRFAPGLSHFRGWLDETAQRSLASQCLSLGKAEAGFYTPIVRGQHPMSVRMLCLGRHWNAITYQYESVRSDIDQLAVPPLPFEFANLARSIAAHAGFSMNPDICIVNWYRAGSRMGLHQDKDESAESIARGVPVVSVSLGDTAVFKLGGLRRKEPVESISLGSGDAFVFGGPARLRYHGVSKIVPGSGPGLGFEGRISLTFREF